MSPKFILLALFFSSLTAGKRIASNPPVTVNPPFDPGQFNQHGLGTDGTPEGDVLRLTKCYCVDTPSRDLPPAYGQFYGSYYGYDYYNYHQNKSYSFATTCRSGELIKLTISRKDDPGQSSFRTHTYPGPECLSWMEEESNICWDKIDSDTFPADSFCAEIRHGKDYYHWKGQRRMVDNHPPKAGTIFMKPEPLTSECQRLCQTIPANTKGYMMDTIESDYQHRIPLAGDPADKGHAKVWEFWNYMEVYGDQADMCEGCA